MGPIATPVTPTGPSPWRTRDFRLVWTGGFVNNIGDWLLQVALPVYVFVESGSGSATAILFVVELLAALVVGPIGGSLVDRLDLRLTLVATNVAQAVTLVPLLWVTGDRVWPAYLVIGVQAMLTQINDPATVALLPRVVAPDQLTVANAANSTSQSLARLVGSPLGGLAVGLGGIEAVVAIDGITFLMIAISTSFVRADTSPITTDVRTGAEVEHGVRAGIDAIRSRPALRNLILVDAVGQIAQGFFVVVFVVFVVRRLDGDGVDVGIIRGMMAVGAIIGAVLIGRFADRSGPARLVTIGYFGMGTASLVFWNMPSVTTALWVYLVVFGLSGFPGSALGIGIATGLQRFSPHGTLGRAVGLAGALGAVARAGGALLTGVLVDRTRLIVLLDVQSAIYLLCGCLALVFVRDGGRGGSARAGGVAAADPVA